MHMRTRVVVHDTNVITVFNVWFFFEERECAMVRLGVEMKTYLRMIVKFIVTALELTMLVSCYCSVCMLLVAVTSALG